MTPEAEARLREDAALAAALAVFPGDGLAWEEYERAVYALTAAVEARTRVGFTELVEAARAVASHRGFQIGANGAVIATPSLVLAVDALDAALAALPTGEAS